MVKSAISGTNWDTRETYFRPYKHYNKEVRTRDLWYLQMTFDRSSTNEDV
jgi:hypothetical protein